MYKVAEGIGENGESFPSAGATKSGRVGLAAIPPLSPPPAQPQLVLILIRKSRKSSPSSRNLFLSLQSLSDFGTDHPKSPSLARLRSTNPASQFGKFL